MAIFEEPFSQLARKWGSPEFAAECNRRAAEGESRMAEAKRREAAQNVQDVLVTVGARYRGCTLDNFELSDEPPARKAQEGVLARLRAFCAAGCGGGLLFFGPAGTGKDHLMVAALRNAAARKIACHWVSGVELYASWRDAIGEERNEHRDLAPLVRPSILAISDPIPPVGELTAHQAAKLFWLIDSRYRAAKPTWATLNAKSGDDASSKITAQIVDRLKHDALALACNWPSYRRTVK